MGKHRQTFRKAHHEQKGDKDKRTCLGCGIKFDSLWIGNRLCKRCQVNVERSD